MHYTITKHSDATQSSITMHKHCAVPLSTNTQHNGISSSTETPNHAATECMHTTLFSIINFPNGSHFSHKVHFYHIQCQWTASYLPLSSFTTQEHSSLDNLLAFSSNLPSCNLIIWMGCHLSIQPLCCATAIYISFDTCMSDQSEWLIHTCISWAVLYVNPITGTLLKESNWCTLIANENATCISFNTSGYVLNNTWQTVSVSSQILSLP